MPIRSAHGAPGVRSRLAAALLVPLLASAACDDGTTVNVDDVVGVWVAAQTGGAEYLVITSDSFLYYQKLDTEDCADLYAFDMTPQGGNVFRLTARFTTGELDVTLDAADGTLTWDEGWGATIFEEETEVDPTAFAVCAGGGDDPAIVCSALPEIPSGEDLIGNLDSLDPEERGRYYDLYRFEPTVGTTPTISLGSAAFDTYLYVYDAGGALMAENDDAGLSIEDSALSLPFDPGCYRIEVTSFADAATGEYTIRIE